MLIFQPIMQMAPYLEQTLITHTQGLLGYNILEFCQVPGSSGELAMFKLSLADNVGGTPS